jgi:hypothetical protein
VKGTDQNSLKKEQETAKTILAGNLNPLIFINQLQPEAKFKQSQN